MVRTPACRLLLTIAFAVSLLPLSAAAIDGEGASRREVTRWAEAHGISIEDVRTANAIRHGMFMAKRWSVGQPVDDARIDRFVYQALQALQAEKQSMDKRGEVNRRAPRSMVQSPVRIDYVSPSTGPAGTTVYISGKSFKPGATVTFGGVPATGVVVSDCVSLQAVVPAGTGTVDVTVTNTDSGTSTLPAGFTYGAAPPPPPPPGSVTVTSITPNSGPTSGGTSVTITGSGFAPGAFVYFVNSETFDSMSATSVVVVNSTTITAITPPFPPGLATVSVQSGGAHGSLNNGFTFTGPNFKPTITSFTPTSGPPGTVVTITGTNFIGVQAVEMSTRVSQSDTYLRYVSHTVVSPTQIQVTVPPDAIDSPILVSSIFGAAATCPNFDVTPAGPPTITSFLPTVEYSTPLINGPSGFITGTNFVDVQEVLINGQPVQSFHVSPTSLNFYVSASNTSGPVTIRTSAGSATTSGPVTVTAPEFCEGPAPTITSITPPAQVPGGAIDIQGNNFDPFGFGDGAIVAFSSERPPGPHHTFGSNTLLQVDVPPSAATGPLHVVTDYGVASAPFTVNALGPPTITSLTQSSGNRTTTVRITGTNLRGVYELTLGGTTFRPLFTSFDGTSLDFMVPWEVGVGSTLTLHSRSGTASATFAVTCNSPTITSFSPTSGAAGTTVCINGTNFIDDISYWAEETIVLFNGVRAGNVSVSGTNQVCTRVPAGATSGPIVVETVYGTATSPTNFTVGTPPPPAPVVSAINPQTGPAAGGTVVTITGSGFSTSPGATTVVFGAAPASAVSCSSTTTCTATSPPGTGTVDVRVTVGAQTSANTGADDFTYAAAPPAGGNADLSIVKTAPPGPSADGTVTFAITVRNAGPGAATGVVVSDPEQPSLAFVRNTGACTTPFPCNLGTLNAGESRTIFATFLPQARQLTNTATVRSSSTDPVSTNNGSTATLILPEPCPSQAPAQVSPAPGASNAPLSGALSWTSNGSSSYNVFFGPAGSGCSTQVASNLGQPAFAYAGLQTGTEYEARVIGSKANCQPVPSACVRFRTTCEIAPVTLIAPLSGTVNAPATFRWTPVEHAARYAVIVRTESGTETEVGSSTSDSLTVQTLPTGRLTWFVRAYARNCTAVGSQSATAGFDSCAPPATPIAEVVGAPSSGRRYIVQWEAVTGAVRYEVDEADNPNFVGATTRTVSGTSTEYVHEVTGEQAKDYYYRVRAFGTCTPSPSPASRTLRVVILPIVTVPKNPTVNIPAGSTQPVIQALFVPGESTPKNFKASADKPWMSVSPSSGILPPEGITLAVRIDPSGLTNGTIQGSVTIEVSDIPLSEGLATKATTVRTVAVSVNLVTPVRPTDRETPSQDTLIIPSVGRLTGANSQWRSDVRILNNSSAAKKYEVVLVPSLTNEVKRTTVDVEPGQTIALDDIVQNWFGFGALGDSATGMLLIRPVGGSQTEKSTVVTSRTYNLGSAGTLGQFIPAVSFRNFIGAGGGALSLQQLAQNASYRTNLGLVEGAGKSASVLVSVFNAAGTKLLDVPIDLRAGEQRQIGSFLAAQGLSLENARLEVRVLGGEGKVTAYASTIDNRSSDALLVSPELLGGATSKKHVVPGVADLTSAQGVWRSDVRIFNSGSVAQTATLAYYTLGSSAPAKTVTVTVEPGEVEVLDNLLRSTFEMQNTGGALHVETAVESALIVTGRTYNQTSQGTVGQFIPAVTDSEAVGAGGGDLHVLQLEESVRYRTNIGLAEVSGRPVTVEVRVILPDSQATPRIEIPLGANEFRQFTLLRELGLTNVYNARVSVRVISGEGRVTVYGSVIDLETGDATYIPAQ